MPSLVDGRQVDVPRDENGRPSDDLLSACVHCGFCVPVCPTWDLLRDENDSPRGRLYLMRAESEGRLGVGGAFTLHLGRCLGCRACETVCPAGVPFGHLLERARARIPGKLPAVERWALWALTASEHRLTTRAMYALGRMVRDVGAAGALGRLTPGRAGRALGLLSGTRPRLAGQSPEPPAASPSEPATATAGHTYTLLTGCVMDGLFGHIHAATRRVLGVAGLREISVPDQVCCGALHAHAGRLGEALPLARLNIQAFERAGTAPIVIDSAGCGAALRDYPAWLDEDPEWRERARAVARRVRDVTEILAAAGSARGRLSGRVAYDAPCHLQHAQGVHEAPLRVLRSIEGLEVEKLPSTDRCCGGAGLYNIAQPELAAHVRAPKLDEIRRGGYDWIATGNPGCIMYLADGLRRSGDGTPVVHPVELVDLAVRSDPAEG